MQNPLLFQKINYSRGKFLYTNKLMHKENYIPTRSNFLEGFKFILDHFNQDRLFPRTIMTIRLGYQKEVFSKEEAMQFFEESDFIVVGSTHFHPLLIIEEFSDIRPILYL